MLTCFLSVFRSVERRHPAVCELDGPLCGISGLVWQSDTEGFCQNKDRRQTQHPDAHRLHDHAG